MRNTMLLTLLLAVQSIIYGQNSLSGKITDQDTQEPVFSANIYFHALPLHALPLHVLPLHALRDDDLQIPGDH